MSDKNKHAFAALALRIGLSLVLIEFGAGKVRAPEAWLLFVPQWASTGLPESTNLLRLLQTHGFVEIIIGIHLIFGFLTRWAAAAAAAMLAVITLILGWTPLGVRDMGLTAGFVALTFTGGQAWAIDALRTRPLVRRLARPVWGASMAYFVMAFYLRPEAPPSALSMAMVPTSDGPFQAIPAVVEVNENKVELGRILFHDVRLSGPQTISCASCHSADNFGADGRARSLGVNGALGTRNSPTVFNAGFNFTQFWDGRVRTLEEQINEPIDNEFEMDSAWEIIVPRLEADDDYVHSFGRIYPDGITPQNIRDAIAEFERALITPDAPFDRYLRGDGKAISEGAKRGKAAFVKLGCVTCHNGVNLGGNSFQTVGKMASFFEGTDETDLGRFLLTGDENDRHVFRVPPLRNVAETAPYFHDGSVATLPDAVRIMARYQLGYEIDERVSTDIVLFLNSLTGAPPRM